jgi:hypothetical protein
MKYAKLDADKAGAMNRSVYATSLEAQMMQPVLDNAAKYKAVDKPFTAGELIAKGF